MEKISIIVPIYNTDIYLERCLNSLINQTYKNLEIILVDDGSTDESGKICDYYSEKDSRIVVVHNTNHGCVWSRKEGIKLSTGKYVVFCDSDDFMEEIAVKEMYAVVQQTNADIVACGFYSDKNGHCYKNKNCLQEGLYDEKRIEYLYANMMFDFTQQSPGVIQSMCGKLFRKELLIEILLKEDDRITLGEDAANLYLYLLNCKKIFLSDKCFYHYCSRENSMCVQKDIDVFKKIDIFNVYMKNNISTYPEHYNLEKQLKAYIVHFIEMAIRNNFGIKMSVQYSFEKKLLDKISGKKIIIYGAGKIGQQFQEVICQHKEIYQEGWTDKNNIGKVISHKKIISIDECFKLEYDFIVVAVLKEDLYMQIKNELLEYVEERKIIWAKPQKESWLRKINI